MAHVQIGGNWKEMANAACKPGGGDLELMRYHLDCGCDPNFQHPEFESTPLIEAVRAGNVEIVRFLLAYNRGPPVSITNNKNQSKGVVVDPTIPSAYENETPLEVAMALKSHVMVDMLLEVLPRADAALHCKTILLTVSSSVAGVTAITRSQRDLVAHLLRMGHRVMVGMDSNNAKADMEATLLTLKEETGNSKLWLVSFDNVQSFLEQEKQQASSGLLPASVDRWIHRVSSSDSQSHTLLQDVMMHFDMCFGGDAWKSGGAGLSHILLLQESVWSSPLDKKQALAQFSWMLTQTASTQDGSTKGKGTTVHAMLEPTNSWWSNLTYKSWCQTWADSVVTLLGLPTADAFATTAAKKYATGNLYDYKLRTIPLLVPPSEEDDDDAGHENTNPATVTLDETRKQQWQQLISVL